MKYEIKKYNNLTYISIFNIHQSSSKETEINENKFLEFLKDQIYQHNFLYKLHSHDHSFDCGKLANFFSFLISRCVFIVNYCLFNSCIILSFENEKDLFQFGLRKEEFKKLIEQ